MLNGQASQCQQAISKPCLVNLISKDAKLVFSVYTTGNLLTDIYDVYCISCRQYQRFLNILFWGCLSGVVGSVNVWCSARRSCHGRGFESR